MQKETRGRGGGRTVISEQDGPDGIKSSADMGQRGRMYEIVRGFAASRPSQVGKEDANVVEEAGQARVSCRLSLKSLGHAGPLGT